MRIFRVSANNQCFEIVPVFPISARNSAIFAEHYSSKERSKVEIVLVLVPALSDQALPRPFYGTLFSNLDDLQKLKSPTIFKEKLEIF